jgi:hypothetical protein
MKNTQRSRTGLRFLLWAFGIIFAGSLLLGLAIVRLLGPDRDLAQIRREMDRTIHAPLNCRIQLNLGPLALVPARIITGFIDDIPPEAHLALSATRRASVGIYRIDGPARDHPGEALFASVEAQMDSDDWRRVVAVKDGDETVMIYLPRDWTGRGVVDVLVAVCDGRELVLVSADLRADPLKELVALHLPDNLIRL